MTSQFSYAAHCKMAAQQLAVNVVDFAKARLPELEALDEELDKNQRDAPRHLRRRARSHTAPFLAKKNHEKENYNRKYYRKLMDSVVIPN